MGATAGLGLSAGTAALSAVQSSNAQAAQANFSAMQYAENQKIAGVEAESAIQQGNVAANQAGEKGRQEIGQQRAAEAASGIDVNSGSAATLQADTAGQTAINEMTIRNNAWRQAWGYQIQAVQAGGQSAFTANAGQFAASSTLLTGGLNAASFGLKGYGSYQNNNGNDGYEKDTGSIGNSAGSSYADYSNVT